MQHPSRTALALIAAAALTATACGSDDGAGSSTTADPAPSTTVADEDAFDVMGFVEALAADDTGGRDNETPGSEAAQQLILEEITEFTEPAFPEATGDEGYFQALESGTNIVGVIPGDDLADEYLLIGAHYDHLGGDCAPDPDDPTDAICNGATDNATGVAAAVDIARSIAADGPPRRSVVLALWDREEDNLDGSRAYVADPLVPLDQTIGYVNFDIQGSNLLPSVARATILVGAETGGPNLVEATEAATADSPLETVSLSLLFGQGRSDHAVLAEAGVPVVFFTDANAGCYHTVQDDLDAVDFDKLDLQIANAEALSRDLVATDTPPEFDPTAPPSTYEDAVELLTIIREGEPDFDLFDPDQRATADQYLAELQAVVDAGAGAFDDDANATLLGGAVDFVAALAEVDCDAFLP